MWTAVLSACGQFMQVLRACGLSKWQVREVYRSLTHSLTHSQPSAARQHSTHREEANAHVDLCCALFVHSIDGCDAMRCAAMVRRVHWLQVVRVGVYESLSLTLSSILLGTVLGGVVAITLTVQFNLFSVKKGGNKQTSEGGTINSDYGTVCRSLSVCVVRSCRLYFCFPLRCMGLWCSWRW